MPRGRDLAAADRLFTFFVLFSPIPALAILAIAWRVSRRNLDFLDSPGRMPERTLTEDSFHATVTPLNHKNSCYPDFAPSAASLLSKGR